MAGPVGSPRRRPSTALAAAWFVGLALLVAGPLLGRGHLILLDFPSGPEFPAFSPLPLPSTGELGNTLPLRAVRSDGRFYERHPSFLRLRRLGMRVPGYRLVEAAGTKRLP